MPKWNTPRDKFLTSHSFDCLVDPAKDKIQGSSCFCKVGGEGRGVEIKLPWTRWVVWARTTQNVSELIFIIRYIFLKSNVRHYPQVWDAREVLPKGNVSQATKCFLPCFDSIFTDPSNGVQEPVGCATIFLFDERESLHRGYQQLALNFGQAFPSWTESKFQQI